MTGALSAVSKQFTKSLVLGTFLPTAVFVIVSLVLLDWLSPRALPLFKPLEALGTGWRITVILLVTLVLSGLLYNLNIPILRLYEGYPWRNGWIGKKLIKRHQIRLDALKARRQAFRRVIREKVSEESITRFEAWRTIVGLQVSNRYATQSSLVLPTHLGNVLRSFETYPDRQYGMSSITLWPRLVAKIDKSYAAAIDEAKSSFDFMLNSSVLSGALALTLLVVGLFQPVSPNLGVWLLEILVLMILWQLFYRGSIGRAAAWGDTVKGAFDLYRWDLLKQLGYGRVPATVADERALWSTISRHLIYGYPRTVEPAKYAPASTFAHGEPLNSDLEVGRGVGKPDADGTIAVTISVRNAGVRPADSLVITDALPEDYYYVWGSASVERHDVRFSGTNPYHFYLEDCTLSPGDVLLLTYLVVGLTQPQDGATADDEEWGPIQY